LSSWPTARGGARRIPGGQEIPENAFLLIRKPFDAIHGLHDDAAAWVAELERIDSRFPYDPELAIHIAEWYKILALAMRYPKEPELLQQYLPPLVKWSEEMVRRSPRTPDVHMAHALHLFLRADAGEPEKRYERYQEALGHLERATELGPAEPGYRGTYAGRLEKTAAQLRKGGEEAVAEQYAEKAEKIKAEADALHSRIIDTI